MDFSLQTAFETLHMADQQQPTPIPSSNSDDLDKILSDFQSYPYPTSAISDSFNIDDFDIDSLDINEFLDSSINPDDRLPKIENPLLAASFNNSDLERLIGCYDNHSLPQSGFSETDEQSTLHQPQSTYSLPSPIAVGSSPLEPKAIDNLTCAQNYVHEQHRLINAASKSKNGKSKHRQSTTVGSIDYALHPGGCQPYTTTVQMQNECVYQQQQYDVMEPKRIQIQSQPRSKFRPRTQNESRFSSHYLRCENHVKPEYPTIFLSPAWNDQSDLNIIEVALMGLDKQPHAYAIDNKHSANTFEDHALIFKQNEQHVLYFRLTDEDFQKGFKTFMIELIKRKQDDVITKELIRARQLDQSMLRFTRIYQAGKGVFHRDDITTEYSSVMVEAYGDVEVEHIGPQYGPMSGQEMVYIVLKGRILKNDLIIDINESTTGWSYRIENFTKNGNVIYFLMPAFPCPQLNHVTADICIYHKEDEPFHARYLYKGSLDQELAALRLDNSSTAIASSSMSNTFNPLDLFSVTGPCPLVKSRKPLTPKRPKRLNKK